MELHRPYERPWGSFTVVDRGTGYQVKRLEVHHGLRLSLQTHRLRREHWSVVVGAATVRVGEVECTLPVGGHVEIPVETLHRLGNPADAPLVVVEVQLGDHLGDDDVVRYEDDFGRATKHPDLAS